MLIWIASYPRSGNTLMITALSEGWGTQSTSVFDRVDGPDGPTRTPAIDHPQINECRRADGPRMLKTHLKAHADSPDPAIFLVRDGRDSVVSYAHFVQDRPAKARPRFAEGRDFDELVMFLIEEGSRPFGTWSESVASWTQRRAPTEIVRYESLRDDPLFVTRQAVSALGVELGEPVGRMPSFDQMHASNPLVVRAGRVGDWRRELPDRAIERFAELHGETLVELGYESSSDPAEWDSTAVTTPATYPTEPHRSGEDSARRA